MVPVVDIFAGPGGLGEGFAQAGFNVLVSAEMDSIACETLRLRKFFHQFPVGEVPGTYYEFIRGEKGFADLVRQYPKQWQAAKDAVLQVEIGTRRGTSELHKKLDGIVREHNNFVLIGGPPCQAYSLAGRARRLGVGISYENVAPKVAERERQKLANKFYEDNRHSLYKQYVALIYRYQPLIFIMENVKGMASARTSPDAEPGSLFSSMCSSLNRPHGNTRTVDGSKPLGYRLFPLVENVGTLIDDGTVNPKEYVIRSENYGVPQARHRIIIMGIRSDIDSVPCKLPVSSRRSTVHDVLSKMPKLRSGLSKEDDSVDNWVAAISEQVSGALCGRTNFDAEIRKALKQLICSSKKLDRGKSFIRSGNINSPKLSEELRDILCDGRIGGVIQHEARTHIRGDLLRYFFCATFAKKHGLSPKMSAWQGKLKLMRPAHSNISISRQQKLKARSHDDRFRVHMWSSPSGTVVSHIAKDGHYFIHPDSSQCRSLTVREAARLQTFPDNYYFCGNRTQQYGQVGNAVPVLLAKKIAASVLDFITSHALQ